MTERITAKQAADFLKHSEDVLILTHKNPDGDALGSGYALWYLLKACGIRAKVATVGSIPRRYAEISTRYEQEKNEDFLHRTVVSVDCASPTLIEEPWRAAAAQCALSIDHHHSNTGYAAKTFLDGDRAACCELIWELAGELGVIPDAYLATCIYTGLSTDTGCFRFRNTTPEALRLAADLYEYGIDAAGLNHRLIEQKSRERLELERRALNTIEYYLDGRIAVIVITQAMLSESGADPSDVEGLSQMPRAVEGVRAGITLREQENGNWKASLRTQDVDAARICAAFGGGGHFGAAGFECGGTLADVKNMAIRRTALEMDPEEYALRMEQKS